VKFKKKIRWVVKPEQLRAMGELIACPLQFTQRIEPLQQPELIRGPTGPSEVPQRRNELVTRHAQQSQVAGVVRAALDDRPDVVDLEFGHQRRERRPVLAIGEGEFRHDARHRQAGAPANLTADIALADLSA
jgi:hypothetical protein